MVIYECYKRIPINGQYDSWSLADRDSSERSNDANTRIAVIQDDNKECFLTIEPEGYSNADTHHESIGAALIAAHHLFGITRSDWDTAPSY